MWIELGLFFLVMIFAIHQIRDERQAQDTSRPTE
jgi:hypothetical protein